MFVVFFYLFINISQNSFLTLKKLLFLVELNSKYYVKKGLFYLFPDWLVQFSELNKCTCKLPVCYIGAIY